MDTKKNSNRKNKTPDTGGGGPGEDRFGGIAPAEHAETRVPVRKSHGRRRRSPRPSSSAVKNGRRSRLKTGLFFVVGLLLCYGAAVYLLVPAVVLGPLAGEAGRFLDCRLSLDGFSLSPFTFRFRGESLSLTASHPVGDEQPLLQVAAVSGQLQLLSLLQGRVRIEGLRLDKPEVFLSRDTSGRYNLPLGLTQLEDKGRLLGKRLQLAPDFLSFQVVDGSFVFDDLLTGNEHRIEQLQYDPVGTDGIWLQATVNGSPVTISRSSENQLQFKLNKVALGPYLAYLPLKKKLPLLFSGLADGTLEVILSPGNPGSRFAIQGVLALENVHIRDRQNSLQADIPAARFSFELALPEGRLRVRELVIREPSCVVTTGSLSGFLAKLEPWPFKTVVQRLLIDQGRLALQAGSQIFHFQDLQASIQGTPGNRTGNGSRPAIFQLSGRQAGDLDGALTLKGTLNSGILNGHLRVSGVDLGPLPKMMAAGQDFAQLKGAAELDAELLVQLGAQIGKQGLYLRNSRLQLHDVQVLTRGGEELSAKRLLCQASEFVFDTTAERPFCDRLDLEQAEIRLPVTGVVQRVEDAVENGSPLFRDLELLDSTIHFVGSDKQDLVSLHRVLVRVHGFSGRTGTPGKIGLQAGIGEQGLLRLSGDITPGKAQLEYAFKDVELTDVPVLRSWSSLQVKEGRIRARGRLIFPQARITGKFVVDDLLAADSARGGLQWRQLIGRGVNVQLQPPVFSLDEAVLDEAVVGFQHGTDGFFPPFSPGPGPDAWWRDSVVVKKITLTHGTFQSGREALLPGWYPVSTDLAGTVEGWPTDSFSFSINGMLEGGGLHLAGRFEEGTIDSALQVDDFPLDPLAKGFLQTYGLMAAGAQLSWQLPSSPVPGKRRSMRGLIKNLRPLPGSPLEYTLALLTDADGEIVLTVEPPEENGRPRVLLQRIVDRLHAIRLRELAQPGATIRDRMPFLELPDLLEFQAGLDRSDELFVLDDYPELLRNRPYLRLVVEGGMDPQTDGAVLQELLQEEADARREVDNLRRQQARAQWMYQHRLKAAVDPSPGSSVASAQDEQIPEELRPLPRQVVEVPPALLENLAGRRAEQVRQYLISRQGIAPERIVVRTSIHTGSTAVFLSLEPFYY